MAPYASHTDNELRLVLRQGDQEAFAEIYNRHHKGIYSYVLGFTKDPVLAEDLVHEVFIKLWEIQQDLEICSTLQGYLYRMAHNMALNALNKMACDDRLRIKALKHMVAIREEGFADSRDLERYDSLLEDALNALPPQRRKVFVLVRHDGKTYDQAAGEMDISVNTVKDHMKKATKTLREFLVDKGEIALALLIIEHFC